MTCATCGRLLPVSCFLVADRRRRGRVRPVRWCKECRARYRAGQPARLATGRRARGTNPRALGTNPRALGTNPRPSKSEAGGQWAAAFRRLDRKTPEQLHELRRALDRERHLLDPARAQALEAALTRALRR